MNSKIPVVTSLENEFPSLNISLIAQKESWRKEVYNPANSTHKWWAKRLGSVFRGIIASSVTASQLSSIDAYNGGLDLSDLLIFDPFAGSGTTCIEALKLGAKVVGYDINPVATLVQRQAIQKWDSQELIRNFQQIESQCKEEIDRVHKTEDGRDVLYYFWVALATCPQCSITVRLFDSPIFSRNAYPKKQPRVQICCPTCLDIKESLIDFEEELCRNGHKVSPTGAVKGQHMTCANGHTTKILVAIKGTTPKFEMFAKMTISVDGERAYESISPWDIELYNECTRLVARIPSQSVLPSGKLAEGQNTGQAIKWNFKEWPDFFNDRQIYSLSLIATAIRDLPVQNPEREALAALFSGTLEFNNLFCSFKGEGTGAVRHMFANHVLKPERTPLEAHPWGTSKSSGSFSTLFKSRIQRADNYKKMPTDLVLNQLVVDKQSGISIPLDQEIASSWKEMQSKDLRAYLKTQSSSETDLPDASVDLVITDPPYMDNVHYAELADFFNAWLKHLDIHSDYPKIDSTRSSDEVQQAVAEDFGIAITKVWKECYRVLKGDGLLAFTFHQARIEGWLELAKSLDLAGFRVISIQPVKGEMTTSLVKSNAKEPSNLDSILVCRKKGFKSELSAQTLDEAISKSISRLDSLQGHGVEVGIGDIRSVLRGTVITFMISRDSEKDLNLLDIDDQVDDLMKNFLSRKSEI